MHPTVTYAIIADIHGNLHALEAVLADIDALGVERVIVNGDLVNRGPQNAGVVERLMAGDYLFTLGNHDDLMLKWYERASDLPAEWFDDPFWEGTAWCVRELAEAGWLDVLRELPMTQTIALEGMPVVLVSHGSPRHYREGYGKLLSDEALAEILACYPADVLIGSHTHRPLERRWRGHQVLNTGAVGAPFNRNPHAQYLLLEPKEGAWQPRFRSVPYDREAALAAFETSGYLAEGGLSARIYYDELRYAISLWTPFWLWSEERGLARNDEAYQHFLQLHAERLQELAASREPGT